MGGIAAIGDVGTASPVVGAQIVGPDNLRRLLRHEHGMRRRTPKGERFAAAPVARQRISLACPQDRFEDGPDRIVVVIGGRPDVHLEALSRS
jgi:hypothetical protein